MKTHQITSHDMTWHLATNHITSPHVTSQPTALLHRSLQPTTSKQVTTSPPWNGWRLVHSNNSVWASQWLVTLCTFYRQILSLTYSFFLGNFRPRLARLYLYIEPTFASNNAWFFRQINMQLHATGPKAEHKQGTEAKEPQNCEVWHFYHLWHATQTWTDNMNHTKTPQQPKHQKQTCSSISQYGA